MFLTFKNMIADSFYLNFLYGHFQMQNNPKNNSISARFCFIALKCCKCHIIGLFVSIRIQNMKIIDGKPEYRGAVDVIVKVVKNEGFFSLWKGFTPYYFRLDHYVLILYLLSLVSGLFVCCIASQQFIICLCFKSNVSSCLFFISLSAGLFKITFQCRSLPICTSFSLSIYFQNGSAYRFVPFY